MLSDISSFGHRIAPTPKGRNSGTLGLCNPLARTSYDVYLCLNLNTILSFFGRSGLLTARDLVTVMRLEPLPVVAFQAPPYAHQPT